MIAFTAEPKETDSDPKYKDIVFINYTFKSFEGLTQRGRKS